MTDVGTPARRGYSLANMLGALAVVFVVVVVLVVSLPRPHENAVKVIDPMPAFAAAARVAPFHVRVPANLPSGWRPTSARVDGPDAKHVVHLHVGYVTPLTEYVSLEESNGQAYTFIALESQHGRLVGERLVGGQVWQERFSPNQKDYSLTRTDADGVTVVVSGSAPAKATDKYAEMAELIETLH